MHIIKHHTQWTCILLLELFLVQRIMHQTACLTCNSLMDMQFDVWTCSLVSQIACWTCNSKNWNCMFTSWTIIKIPILMPVQNAFFCTGIPTFSYASTKWKKYILANSVKKKYTGKQCVFLYWHEDQIYNILARLSVLAHPSKKFICQYKMENNILATNVFLYWRRTNSQTYW